MLPFVKHFFKMDHNKILKPSSNSCVCGGQRCASGRQFLGTSVFEYFLSERVRHGVCQIYSTDLDQLTNQTMFKTENLFSLCAFCCRLCTSTHLNVCSSLLLLNLWSLYCFLLIPTMYLLLLRHLFAITTNFFKHVSITKSFPIINYLAPFCLICTLSLTPTVKYLYTQWINS